MKSAKTKYFSTLPFENQKKMQVQPEVQGGIQRRVNDINEEEKVGGIDHLNTLKDEDERIIRSRDD